ncbi:MAG: glycosyltransferase family 2 protein [Cellvibrio sp.]|uniref:glycosyltransferase family 2 protein n=1 Tax=Cellvibrio sp. TaxID=1965322 RepID=UPI002723BFE4|nr:glycosyltransferase family 2 protein [Cellvibrio sp.]
MFEPLLSQEPDDALPLVTVVMPVYNAGKYLRLAVLSIVTQTYHRWELLIIDDGSTDNALQNIADINDARIRILQDGKNKGLAARLNECIDLANGKYIARMDQDDVSYPERLAKQVAMLDRSPLLDLIGVRAITISEKNEATGMLPWGATHEVICAHPWLGFYLPHPTWMGRTEWFRKHYYAQPAPYFCEDQELLLRSYEKSRFGMVSEPLFAYRVRGCINWRKLLKTRATVLQVQLGHFALKKQYVFGFMAALTFLARVVSDMVGSGHFRKNSRFNSDQEKFFCRWREVYQSVQGK